MKFCRFSKCVETILNVTSFIAVGTKKQFNLNSTLNEISIFRVYLLFLLLFFVAHFETSVIKVVK